MKGFYFENYFPAVSISFIQLGGLIQSLLFCSLLLSCKKGNNSMKRDILLQ